MQVWCKVAVLHVAGSDLVVSKKRAKDMHIKPLSVPLSTRLVRACPPLCSKIQNPKPKPETLARSPKPENKEHNEGNHHDKDMKLFILLFNVLTICRIYAELVGGILLPHGDFAYDPTFFRPNSRERVAADRIATASRQAGKWLVDVAKPEIIFLSTPHGIKLDNDFGIYMSDEGFGTATIGSDVIGNSTYKQAYNVSKDVDMDLQLSKDLLASLHDKNVSGIYSFSEGSPMILNWGEIIPLLLLPQDEGGRKSYRHMIWSQPQRRYDHVTEMVPELLKVGQTLAKWIQNRPERIAVIISGDLSHTHLADGPYGYSNASSIFDKALGKWASNPHLNANALLKTAKELQPRAMSCGFTGYIMLHGMLTRSSLQRSMVYADLNVTYYGMMAAAFGVGMGTEQTPKTKIVNKK